MKPLCNLYELYAYLYIRLIYLDYTAIGRGDLLWLILIILAIRFRVPA